MKIDYNKVVTKEYFSNMDEEKLEILKQEGERQAQILKRTYDFTKLQNPNFLSQKAQEIAHIGKKYTNLEESEKQILAANITLKDESVIEALLDKGINYNTLYYYSTLISKIKKLVSIADELDINEDITIINKRINYICSIIRLYFGVTDFTLIVNKLNEIAATKKTLYMKKQNSRIK